MGSSGEVAEALTAFEDAVNGLLGCDLTRTDDDEVVEVLRRVEAGTRALSAVQHRLVVQVDERAIAVHAGLKTARRFLIETLRLSNAEAASRVKAAHRLGIWHDVRGEESPPVLPHTAQAQEAGDISSDHARRVGEIMRRIPRAVEPSDRALAEEILAELACRATPEDVDRVGVEILAHLDPDGALTDDRDRARRRGLVVGKQRADLMSPVKGELDPVARALLDPILAKWARPGMNNPDDQESPTGDGERVDTDRLCAAAARDTRTTAQRNHDALVAMLKYALSSGALGEHRGLAVTAVLTMNLADVEDAAGVATTATGGLVPIADALRLAERSHRALVLFDHQGVPLHFGRARRLATPAQRLAWIAAIRGCSRPGCDAPASLSALHHITDWAKGGTTDIDNLTLACDACHALIHDGPGGWKTIVGDQDSEFPGRTLWIAPPHIDPTGTPRVNHRHHAGEQLAQAARCRRAARTAEPELSPGPESEPESEDSDKLFRSLIARLHRMAEFGGLQAEEDLAADDHRRRLYRVGRLHRVGLHRRPNHTRRR